MTKTIIITGASSGIGEALARHLAALNHNVIAVGRNKKALEELQKSYSQNIKIVVADITKNEDQLKINNALDAKDTGVFLVHNAGVAAPQMLVNLSEEEWDKHYLTNVKAPIFITKLLLPHLRNGGRILNISTGLAHAALIGMTSYGVSKASLFMWKEYCNAELNSEGIVCGSAMPGVVDTRIQEELRKYNLDVFPSANIFRGFFQRDELLPPATAAKFLTWLLFEVKNEKFMKGDWDIYDVSHHQHWVASGEVTQRK
ncbi:MAG: short-chain dehydrogenase/reductase SDR [uncultured bacterium]|nr:MAG: short-chain dehydrogenase/reductase SDR [uncultured bacterium]